MKNRERQTRSARTVAAQAGVGADRAYGAVSAPIYPSAIFRYEEFGKHQGFDYSRAENPTRRALEEVLAELEKGSRAVAFASGMAAVSATLGLFVPDGSGHVHRWLHHPSKVGSVCFPTPDDCAPCGSAPCIPLSHDAATPAR